MIGCPPATCIIPPTSSVVHQSFQCSDAKVDKVSVLSVGLKERRVTWYVAVLLKLTDRSQTARDDREKECDKLTERIQASLYLSNVKTLFSFVTLTLDCFVSDT